MYPPSRPAPGEKSSALMLPECPCIVVRRHRMFGRCSLRLNASRWNSSVSLCSSARLDEQSPKANSSTVPLPHLNFDMSPSPLSCSRHPLMQRSLLPDMIALPSGAHRQQLTICMWPWRIARHSPLDTLQIRTALSFDEVHIRVQSGEKSQPEVHARCVNGRDACQAQGTLKQGNRPPPQRDSKQRARDAHPTLRAHARSQYRPL
mmetsp:Transcript_9265/g.21658  ORF Transcript_9265/g.21658 Transcript_9265/m.21658 type:complete len:205 (-) Transcript_9265:284-898(-)